MDDQALRKRAVELGLEKAHDVDPAAFRRAFESAAAFRVARVRPASWRSEPAHSFRADREATQRD